MGPFRGILLCIGVSLAATACGSYTDGDQWAGVTVANNTNSSVTLDMHPARYLTPGQSTLLNVDSNSNPQALRLMSADGRVLGCLTFRFHTTTPKTFSFSVSDATRCDESLRLLSG